VAELVQRDDPFRHRRATHNGQHTDRFNIAIAALWSPQRHPGQRRSSCSDRVERVGLAISIAGLAIRAINLDELDLGAGQVASEPCAIRTGAFHPDEANRSIRTEPPRQMVIPGLGRVERFDAENTTEVIHHGSNMDIGVRVNTTNNETSLLYDGHCHPSCRNQFH